MAYALKGWNLSHENRQSLIAPAFSVFMISVIVFFWGNKKGIGYGLLGAFSIGLIAAFFFYVNLLFGLIT